jgi:hypothetical protein
VREDGKIVLSVAIECHEAEGKMRIKKSEKQTRLKYQLWVRALAVLLAYPVCKRQALELVII